MKKTKILLAILLSALFVVFALGSGFGKVEESQDAVEHQNVENIGENTEENTEEVTEDDFDILNPADKEKEFSVTILDATLAKNMAGKDAIVVRYEFKNLDGDTVPFTYVYNDAAYQNGISLNITSVLDDSNNFIDNNKNTKIKPGATLEVVACYELIDTTSDVEIEVEERQGYNRDIVKKTFIISD